MLDPDSVLLQKNSNMVDQSWCDHGPFIEGATVGANSSRKVANSLHIFKMKGQISRPLIKMLAVGIEILQVLSHAIMYSSTIPTVSYLHSHCRRLHLRLTSLIV